MSLYSKKINYINQNTQDRWYKFIRIFFSMLEIMHYLIFKTFFIHPFLSKTVHLLALGLLKYFSIMKTKTRRMLAICFVLGVSGRWSALIYGRSMHWRKKKCKVMCISIATGILWDLGTHKASEGFPVKWHPKEHVHTLSCRRHAWCRHFILVCWCLGEVKMVCITNIQTL